jgi:hypothetical protein
LTVPLVTGTEVLDTAGVPSAGRDPATLTWADQVAGAIIAAVTRYMGAEPVPADPGYPEIQPAALLAALELYKRREAPYGVTGWADPMGQAIRLARDYIQPIQPILARWRPSGPVTIA